MSNRSWWCVIKWYCQEGLRILWKRSRREQLEWIIGWWCKWTSVVKENKKKWRKHQKQKEFPLKRVAAMVIFIIGA